MAVRAIRGATRLQADDAAELHDAVAELVQAMITNNDLDRDDLISIIFTATPDLHCGFPAAAARGLGLTDVPLMCAQEIEVPGAMSMVVRVMMHVDTDRSKAQIWHPYLRGTDALRAGSEDE
ncbi:MAG: chorismate mutase [Candidatus Nanopelagicales bacterium]